MNTGNKITAVLTIIMMAGLPLACKPIQKNSGEPATEALPCGAHTLISIDGHPVPYAPMHDGGQAPEVSGGSLTINSDGTFTCNIKFSDPNITAVAPSGEGRGQPGTYTRDGNTLTLKHPGAGYTPVTIAGDTLTMNNEGMLFVFQKESTVPVAVAAEKQSGTRTPEQVLDQLIGTWSQEATAFKAKWTPEEKHITGTFSVKRTLGGKFLLANGKDSENNRSLQLYTYDPKQNCYRGWGFWGSGSSSGGPDKPMVGNWDETTQTLDWIVSEDNGQITTSQWRIINEDATTTTLKEKDAAGELLVHIEFKSTRLKEAQNLNQPETESNTLPQSQTPEQKVLDGLLGNWNCEVTLNTLGANPEKKQYTEKQIMTRILNGTFIQDDVESSLGDSLLILYTYDQQKQCYRLWGFSSERAGSDFWWNGTWDPTSREINWSSQAPGAYSATGRQRFISDNKIEFSWKVMDNSQTLLSEGLTKLNRATGAMGASGAMEVSGATGASATAAIAPNITPPPDIQNDGASSAASARTNDKIIMLPGDVPLEMIQIPAGTFMMGSPMNESGRGSYETQHEVTLTQDFYLGKYEITQQQWLAVMGSWPVKEPSPDDSLGDDYLGDDYPAHHISWNDAQNFITALNTHITSTGQGAATFRLPTEAEWEYACRAGTTTRYYFGDSLDCDNVSQDCAAGVLPGNRSDYMWYCGNISQNGSKPVGKKLPNAFGLYDMSGNVWEWCQDWYDTYPSGSVTDPKGPASGSCRVLRGGSWFYHAYHCRSANRLDKSPDNRDFERGFRLAR